MALTICAKCKREWQANSGTEPCPWCRASSAESSLAAMRQRTEATERCFHKMVAHTKESLRKRDAALARAERAEAIILDESMDHKAHGFCDCPLCKFAESIAPPADASKTGGEREHPYGYCPACGAPGIMRERRPNGDDRCANGHTYPSKDAVMEQKS